MQATNRARVRSQNQKLLPSRAPGTGGTMTGQYEVKATQSDALYATKLLGAETADWRCTGCDPGGLDLQAGAITLRLDFPERVTGPGELRKMLVKLAGEARAKE